MTENIFSMDLAHSDTRVSIYRWLSTLFAREIDPETLDEYQQGAGELFLKELSTIPALTSVVKALEEQIGQKKRYG